MKHFRPTALVATAFLAISSLQAAPLYWDPNATTGTALGGTGNWDLTDSFWYNGTADIVWPNASDDAFFTGTAGTVTLTTSLSAGDLFFTNTTGSYLVTNATGAEVLTLVNGTIDTGGSDHTVAAPISTSALSKNGDGRLHLTVDNSAGLTGTVAINQGDVSVDTNNAVGGTPSTSITMADGAALVLNGGTNGLTAFYPKVTINGTGITNSGALRNLSGVTTFYGQIVLNENNSVIYVDGGAALVYDGENGPLTDNGNNYNLIISGSAVGNFYLGQTSIGGTLMVEGPAACYSYLTGITPTTWPSTYVSPGGTFYVENNNSFGTQPASLMTTNVILDGGAISSAGTYTMYTTDGITVTTNGGALTNTSGTWTTCNIYSSNTAVTFAGAGSFRPGGAAGISAGTINLGTGALIKSGGGDANLTFANPSLEIYSNLVLNGGSLSFNYDQTSGQLSSLGALPSTLYASNIIFNGGSLHVGHTSTIGATRGIYVASGGGTIEDVTSSGTATVAGPIIGPGSMNFPLGKSGSTTAVTLTANNSYTGTTTVGASCTLNVGSGGSTGTIGTGNTTDNGTLVFNRSGTYSYGGIIGGSGVLTKSGSGTVTLTGASTYSGATTVSAGELLINNTTGSGTGTGAVTVNATLGGTGSIGGAVTVGAAGTLSPGTPTTPLGKLTINNNLTLVGNVAVSVNRTSQTNSVVAVTGTLSNTGTTNKITVANLGPPLVAGDKFFLFSQPVSGGNTIQITGASGVTWSNSLAADGSIVVAAPSPNPVFNGSSLSGANLVLSGTNGYSGGTFYVLSTTNVALPVSTWSRVSTNTFDGSGNFSVTNQQTTNSQRFYIIELK